jgi:3-oxoacyl-[acyl-carrier protein] reductase
MATNLSNKTALGTGASRGIGRAAALALAAAGAQVVVHYGRNAEQAKAVVDEIRTAGGRADAISADLAAPNGPHALAERLRKRVGERLDILVLNAGISNNTPFEDMTIEEFDALFAVNVRAPYFLVQQLLPMLGDGSTIIFLSSLGARVAVGSLAAYASTKGAISTLVKYFAVAFGPRGIASTQWPRSHRYRYVEFHKDRRWPNSSQGNASTQAHRPARGCRLGRRFPGLG